MSLFSSVCVSAGLLSSLLSSPPLCTYLRLSQFIAVDFSRTRFSPSLSTFPLIYISLFFSYAEPNRKTCLPVDCDVLPVPINSIRSHSIRLDSSPFDSLRLHAVSFVFVRFGSVRFRSSTNVSVMFSWFRSVRFGLIRFRSIPFDSVRFRFDWFHLVFHSFPVSSVRLCSVPLNPSRFHSVPFVSVRFRPILVGFIPIGFIQSLNPFQSVRFGSISESFHLVMFHSVPFGSVRFHSDLSSRVYFSPFDRGPFHLVVFCSIRFPFHSARLTLEDENQAALYGVFQR